MFKNQIKHIKLIVIFTVCGNTFGQPQSIVHHEVKQQLVTHLEELKKTDFYWATLEHAPKKHFLTNTMTLCLFSWNEKIHSKRKLLHKEIIHTATLLGEIHLTKQVDPAFIKRTYKQCNKIKKSTYKKPTHVIQKIDTYFLLFGTGCALYYGLNHYNITPATVTIAWNNIKKNHIDQPIEELKEIFTNTNNNEQISNQKKQLNTNADIILNNLLTTNDYQNIISTELNGQEINVISLEKKAELIQKCFDHGLTRSPEILLKINGVIEKIKNSNGESDQASLANRLLSAFKSTNTGKTIDGTLDTIDIIKEIVGKTIPDSTGHFYATTAGFSFVAQYAKLELNRIIKGNKLTLAMIALIPTTLLSAAGYIGIKHMWNALTKDKREQLKKDLIGFEMHLNNYRYYTCVSELPPFYYGMNYYWTTKLKTYRQDMSIENKIYYSDFLDELQDDHLTPEQKTIIISAIFKQFKELE